MTRPAALQPIRENFPAELTSKPNWCVWRYEQRSGSWTKPPYRPNGQACFVSNPKHWAKFETAWDAYEQSAGRYDGLGFVLTPDLGLVGLDIDDCLPSDNLPGLLDGFGKTYSEMSPSGAGLRAFFKGKLPGSRRKNGSYEAYDGGRYLTITGHRLGGDSILTDQFLVDRFYHKHLDPPSPKPRKPSPVAMEIDCASDDWVLSKLRGSANREKFERLYAGDHSGFPSTSEAHLALASMIAFYTQDSSQIERILLSSGFDSDKLQRPDYLARTIDKALQQNTSYDPNFRSGSRSSARPTSPPPTKPDAGQSERLPRIKVGPDQHRVNDEAVALLAGDGSTSGIYQRGAILVRVVTEAATGELGKIFSAGTPRIEPVPADTLRETFSRLGYWFVEKKNAGGDWESIRTSPPAWCASQVLSRTCWPGTPFLNAIIECPTLRPDGSILDKPGLDSATGLLYQPNGSFPEIPNKPTKSDAIAAVERIRRLVHQFPFVADCDFSAWLSIGLTLAGRFTINGPVPLGGLSGNTPGLGKSRLAVLWPIALFGRKPAPANLPSEADQLSKFLLSIALKGARLVFLDNEKSGSTVGSKTLDAVLTATSWEDRVLGINRVVSAPLYAQWLLTGNNLSFGGDLARRLVLIELESPLERPDQRNDLEIPDLESHVESHRGEIVRDLLTILRAHALTGWIGHSLGAVGSFEDWDRVVRSALLWLGLADPRGSLARLRENDPQTLSNTALVHGWAELPGADEGLTIAEGLELLDRFPSYAPTLRNYLASQGRNGKPPDAQRVGYLVRSIRNRVYEGKRIVAGGKKHQAVLWKSEACLDEQVSPQKRGGWGG